jgi:hypothetical protein
VRMRMRERARERDSLKRDQGRVKGSQEESLVLPPLMAAMLAALTAAMLAALMTPGGRATEAMRIISSSRAFPRTPE